MKFSNMDRQESNFNPPSGLQRKYYTIFFLLNYIFEGQTSFLVYHHGRFHWIKMHLQFLEVVQNLRNGVPLERVDWNSSCERIQQIVTQIPFFLGHGIIEVTLNDIILPRRINVKIQNERGEIVLAKYLGCESTNRDENSFVFMVQETDEQVIIPIVNIITHATTRDDIESYKKDLERKASEELKKQMRQKGELVKYGPQRNYPVLSDHLLQILYHLSVRCNVKIGFKYLFNLLVFRLLSFGSQIRFQLPQLSEEEQVTFEAFKTKYNNEMVGRVIRSRKARFQSPEPSGILEGLKRLFEYYCNLFELRIEDYYSNVAGFLQRGEKYYASLAETMANSVEVLSLPDSYWVQPEQGVEVRKLKSKFPMFHHLFRNRDVFDKLVQ